MLGMSYDSLLEPIAHLVYYKGGRPIPPLPGVRSVGLQQGGRHVGAPTHPCEGVEGGSPQGAGCQPRGGGHKGGFVRQGPHNVLQHQRLACPCGGKLTLVDTI